MPQPSTPAEPMGMRPSGARDAMPSRGLPWPPVAASAVLLGLTAAIIGRMRAMTEGHYVYPLDDSYIHMAMAKTLARHGSWGLSAGHFDPASSAPIWTLLLAGLYRLGGVHVWGPLVLSGIASVMVIALGERVLRPYVATPVLRATVLLGIAWIIPLPALIVTGMEAPLHAFLTLLLTWTVVERLAAPPRDRRPSAPSFDLGVGALSLLCMLTRFESAFLIAVLASAAWVKGRRRTALALAAGTLGALGSYAAVALPQGGLWLPNAVLLKPAVTHLHTGADWAAFLWRIPEQLTRPPNAHLSALLLAAIYLLLPRPSITGPRVAVARGLLAVFVPALLFHVQFADLGWFFRYEAYLVTLGAVAITAAVAAGLGALPHTAARWRGPLRAALVLGCVVLAVPLVVRAARSMRKPPLAARNIYEQQFQMGRLIRDAFGGQVAAVNDIGAVGYLGEIQIVDLIGLGTTSVARAMRAGRWDRDAIERLCRERRVRVALVYESWFANMGGLPRAWRRVGRWTIRDNIICGDRTVSIFATDPLDEDRVREALRAFTPRLPRRVSVDIPG